MEVGLKLFFFFFFFKKTFGQTQLLIKDMAGFFFFVPPSAVVLFLSLSFLTKRGPLSLEKKGKAESTFQMQTPLPLSLRLSVVPLRVFSFSHRLACCA